MHPLVCPHCGGHAVQKVSAVVEVGWTTTQLSGPAGGYGVGLGGYGAVWYGWASLAGSSQTVLSRRLALPPPAYISPWAERPRMSDLLLIDFVGVLAGVLFSLVLPDARGLVVFGVLAALALTLLVWLDKEQKAKERQASVVAALPAYRRALARWQTAWWCSQCDVCLFPGTPVRLVPASQVQAFCYGP